MRNVILTTLLFIMVLPSLACAMPCHEMSAKTPSDQPPCHGQEESAPDGPRLMEECTGVDYATQADQSLELPNHTLLDSPSLAADKTIKLHALAESGPIRGPPDRHRESHFSPPVLLTTQRLRI